MRIGLGVWLVSLVTSVPLSLRSGAIDIPAVNELCGRWYGADGELVMTAHISCTRVVPENWIKCPSRSRAGECSYYCPSHDITVPNLPTGACPAGAKTQEARAGWVPWAALGPNIAVNVDDIPGLKSIIREGKMRSGSKPGGLRPYLSGARKRAYTALKDAALESARDFYSRAFGIEYTGGITVVDDVFRKSGQAPGPHGVEWENVHIDGDLDRDGHAVYYNEILPTEHSGTVWRHVEVNVWVGLQNSAVQPFIILDDSVIRETDVCKVGNKIKLSGTGEERARGGHDAYCSAWPDVRDRVVRFSGIDLFHGKRFNDDVQERFSVDFRFTVPYNTLLAQIRDTHDAGALRNQYETVLRRYAGVPRFFIQAYADVPRSIVAVCTEAPTTAAPTTAAPTTAAPTTAAPTTAAPNAG